MKPAKQGSALGISVDAAKQALSRARRSLAAYDAKRAPSATTADIKSDAVEQRRRRDEATFGHLFAALIAGDTKTVESLLSDDVEAWADGAGEFFAAKIVLRP